MSSIRTNQWPPPGSSHEDNIIAIRLKEAGLQDELRDFLDALWREFSSRYHDFTVDDILVGFEDSSSDVVSFFQVVAVAGPTVEVSPIQSVRVEYMDGRVEVMPGVDQFVGSTEILRAPYRPGGKTMRWGDKVLSKWDGIPVAAGDWRR